MLARSFWLIAFAALMNITQATPGRTADAVNVATPSIVIFAIPYWIAEQKGYFKDENIEPALEVVANQREIGQRVLNGASQFSITGPDATIVDAINGGPSRILAGAVRKPPLYLIAKSSIKTFADLRGANIGALSLTEGSSKLLIKMAKAEGLAAAQAARTRSAGTARRTGGR